MASELPPEVTASYSAIIDEILASSDLTTVSAKRIRKGLQEKVEYDITPQKDAITALIMSRFDKFSRDSALDTEQAAPPPPPPAATTNGTSHTKSEPHVKSEASPPTSPAKRKASPSSSDLSDEASPPAKKPKKAPKVKQELEETDEQIAKRMQAELNAGSARATRGGGAKPRKQVKPKSKTPKKKSKAKVNSDDDSEVESGSDKPERPKTGGFHKPMILSEPLADLLKADKLSRPQTVKQIWAYVKERDLQDPNDKRQIRCDEAMRAVFRTDKVHMFTMNKLLKQHLYAEDE